MREHPWNIRRVTHRQVHDHRNLLDLHFLTHAWAKPEGPAVANPFEKEPTLEDDTTPESVLIRLEEAIRRIQASVLRKNLPREASLDELSWSAGRECAARRWPAPDPKHPGAGPADKRALLGALYHSPLAGRKDARAFLVRRAVASEVSLELLDCPHRRGEAETIDDATRDALCRQQFHWLRGYFAHLNPSLTPSLALREGRCVLSW